MNKDIDLYEYINKWVGNSTIYPYYKIDAKIPNPIKVEIQDNKDFYNEWHSNKYYENYLSIQKDEIFVQYYSEL